ncbi:MAG TPA: DoxX family protein [Opitutaceae bacterium]|nr:DoxX family protein [Opitutaceae bacterium]
MKKLLTLSFLPTSANLALLVLRLWLGLTMVIVHGWPKLTGFSSMASGFFDPLGIGSRLSLGLSTFAELVCAALVAIGLAARFAAAVLVVNLGVAFLLVHKLALTGAMSGEIAFVYLAGFVAILVAGPGRYAVDGRSG